MLGKIDLLPYTDFDFEQFRGDFRKLNHDAPVFQVSCKTSSGLGEWAAQSSRRL